MASRESEGSELRVVQVESAESSVLWISLDGGNILFWRDPVEIEVSGSSSNCS